MLASSQQYLGLFHEQIYMYMWIRVYTDMMLHILRSQRHRTATTHRYIQLYFVGHGSIKGLFRRTLATQLHSFGICLRDTCRVWPRSMEISQICRQIILYQLNDAPFPLLPCVCNRETYRHIYTHRPSSQQEHNQNKDLVIIEYMHVSWEIMATIERPLLKNVLCTLSTRKERPLHLQHRFSSVVVFKI